MASVLPRSPLLRLASAASASASCSSTSAPFRGLLSSVPLGGLLHGGLLGAVRSKWSPASKRPKPAKRHNYDPEPDRVVPWDERRPFSQKNQRRDDVLVPRHAPAVPSTPGGVVQAWLSSWEAPRAGIVPLRADVWDMPLRPDIVHRVVFWQRACMRQGTAMTKNRAGVRGGGKKPRPQKGTGRSRQGSIRAPQWRGGGRAFPKRLRSYKFFLPRKVQTLGLKVALSDKYRRGALVVVDDLTVESHKTKELEAKLLGLGIDLERHRVMMLTAGAEHDLNTPALGMAPLVRAARNIFKVTTQTAEQCNVFDLVRHQLLVVDRGSLSQLETRLADEVSCGHVYREDQPKLSLYFPVSDGPGRAHLDGGRKYINPRIVPSENWS